MTKIGVDFGAANITLCDSACDVSREKSLALIDKETNALLALGDDALRAENPAGIVVQPFSRGIMEFPEMTAAFIDDIVKAVNGEQIRAVVALPSVMPVKTEKDLYMLFLDSGVSEVYGVSRSYAAFLGAGGNPLGSAVSVNIGAAATDITVIYQGQIVLSTCEKIGGNDFDTAVIEYVRSISEVEINPAVASAIKEKLGSVWEGKADETLHLEGILTLTGNAIAMDISAADLTPVFEQPLKKLLLAIADTVKRIPTECIGDIMETGIILTGGGAELFGLDKMIQSVFEIPTHKPQIAPVAVARGMARIHSFLPVRMRVQCKNVTDKIADYFNDCQKEKK